MKQADELKACPFCGCQMLLDTARIETNIELHYQSFYLVKHPDDEHKYYKGHCVLTDFAKGSTSKNLAIEEWNRRA